MVERELEVINKDSQWWCQEYIRRFESGVFYPNLVPDEATVSSLRDLQSELSSELPSLKLANKLHCTIFFSDPKFLHDYIKDNIFSDVDRAMLYSDLLNTFTSAGIAMSDFVLPTESIERFGDDGSIVALKLGKTAVFESWRQDTRELFKRNLIWHGVDEEHRRQMVEMPEFKWSFGDSQPHITLAKGLVSEDLPDLQLPKSVKFMGLNAGKIKFGETLQEAQRFLTGL